MRTAELNEVIVSVRDKIRRGQFIQVARDADSLAILKQAAEAEDVTILTCLQASVMLAEMYDQMGRYSEAERFLEFDPHGEKALQLLKRLVMEEVERADKLPKQKEQERRRLLRALAFFCLQHAIAWHRDTTDVPRRLGSALWLAQSAGQCLERLPPDRFRFDGAKSMFQYWSGRFHALNRNWKDARTCFRDSMQHEQENLMLHLEQHAKGKHAVAAEELGVCAKCQSRIAYTNYLLASNMAFGLALVELEEGTVENALTLLRPAQIMLEGSTFDEYRKGYVRLLIGKAERIRAGASEKRISKAIALLREAARLFTDHDSENATHSFYAAATHHQLCLAYIFSARDARISLEAKERNLLKALRHFVEAERHLSLELQAEHSDQYLDRNLQVRLVLAKSRLLSEILKTNEFPTGGGLVHKLQNWVERSGVQDIGGFSPAWAKCLRTSSVAITDDALSTMIAEELLANTRKAGRLDAELSGGRASRSYMLLAEAEAIVTIVEFAGKYANRKIPQSEAASLVGAPLNEAIGFLEKNELSPTRTSNSKKYVWRDIVLAVTLANMKKLARERRTNLKVYGAAEVMLAKLYFLTGDMASANRYLQENWEPIESQVENRILHDAVAELRGEIKEPDSPWSEYFADEERFPDWTTIEQKMHSDVVALLSKNMDDNAIAARLKRSVGTVRNWRNGEKANHTADASK
jgi:hypothetical protein